MVARLFFYLPELSSRSLCIDLHLPPRTPDHRVHFLESIAPYFTWALSSDFFTVWSGRGTMQSLISCIFYGLVRRRPFAVALVFSGKYLAVTTSDCFSLLTTPNLISSSRSFAAMAPVLKQCPLLLFAFGFFSRLARQPLYFLPMMSLMHCLAWDLWTPFLFRLVTPSHSALKFAFRA